MFQASGQERRPSYGKARFGSSGDSGEGGRGHTSLIDLFVGNLPPRISQEGIENLFSEHSDVQRVSFGKPKENGASPSFAFVKVPSMTNAERCIQKLNGFMINGCRLRVQISDKHKSTVMSSMTNGDQECLHEEDMPLWPVKEDSQPMNSSTLSAKSTSAPACGMSQLHMPRQTIGRGSSFSPSPSVGRGTALSSVAATSSGRGSSASFPVNSVGSLAGAAVSSGLNTSDGQLMSESSTITSSSSGAVGKSPEGKVSVPPRPCLYCNKSGRLQCGQCKGPYCSRQCQRADWEKHRTTCVPKALSVKASSSSSNAVVKTNFDVDNVDQMSEFGDDNILVAVNVEEEVERLKHLTPEKQVEALAHLGEASHGSPREPTPFSTAPANGTYPVEAQTMTSSVQKGEPKVFSSGQLLHGVVQTCTGLSVWLRYADADRGVEVERLQAFLKGHPTPDQLSHVNVSSTSLGKVCLLYHVDRRFCRAKLTSVTFDTGGLEKMMTVDLIDDGASEVVTTDRLYELPADLQPPTVPAQSIRLVLSDLQLSLQGQANTVAFLELLNKTVIGQHCQADITSVSQDGTVFANILVGGKSVGGMLQRTPFVEPYFPRKSDSPSLPRHSMPRPAAPLTSPTACSVGPLAAQFRVPFHPAPVNSLPARGAPLAVRLQGPILDMPSCVVHDASGFQRMQLTMGFTNVKIASISPFAQLFVQVADSDWQHKLQQLNEDMNRRLMHTKNSRYTPREGDICCARFLADKRFYRARVERVLLDGRADIYFVDFGNMTTVPIAELRHMKADFGMLPFQAIRVLLAGVQPAEVSGSWTHEARGMLQQPQHLVAKLIAPSSRPDDPAYVELFDRTVGLNVLLNQELIVVGLGVPAPMLHGVPTPPPVSMALPSATLAPETSPSLPRAAQQTPEMRFDVGKTYQVHVIYTWSPSLFHVSVADEALQQQLTALNSRIHLYCSDQGSYDSSFRPAVAELCCARLGRNGHFYRARVVGEQPTTRQPIVHFVDLGCREFIRYDDIRRIQQDMLELPFLSVACSLHNSTKEQTNWSKAANVLFEELTKDKVLRCVCQHVGTSSPVHSVELFDDTQPQQPVDIGAMVVAAGLAQIGRANCRRSNEQTIDQAVKPVSSHGVGDQTNSTPPSGKQPVSDHLSQPSMTARSSATSSLLGNKQDQPGSLQECSQYGHKLVSCLSRETLPEGKKLQVILTHATAPSSFFVQRKERYEELLELCEEIRKHCSEINVVVEDRPTVGDLCCAVFEGDKNYYRAVVDEVLSGDRLKVTYLDFGNSAVVPMSTVLPPYLVGVSPQQKTRDQLKVQAIECCLALDLPAGILSWPQEVVELLMQCINQDYDVAVLKAPSTADEKTVVDVFDLQTGASLCENIREQFLSKVLTPAPAASQLPSTQVSKEVSSEGPTAIASDITLQDEPPCVAVENKKRHPSIPSSVASAGRLSPFGASLPPSAISSPTSIGMKISDMQREHLPDGEVSAIITNLTDPSSFFMQVNSESSKELVTLMEQMNAKYGVMTSHERLPLMPDVVCAAFFAEDQGWYRASIDLVMDEDQVYVTYVDFGNTALLPPSQLRPLLPEFCSLPLQAVRCRLAGIAPFPKGTDWSQTAIDLFKAHMGGGVFVRCTLRRFGQCVEGEQPVKVVSAISPPRFVNDVLVAERCAHKLLGSKPTAPAVATPKFMSSDLTGMALPADEEFLSVMISEFESPSSLYLQLARKEVAVTVDRLSSELARYCQHAEQVPLADLAVGELCAALWHVDHHWYRAAVCEVAANHVLVRFVDFGNKEKVEAGGIRHLEKSFLNLPRQSLYCRMHGIESCLADGSWSPEANTVFDRLSSSPLCAKISGCGEDGLYEVELFDTSTDVDVNLQQELINGGWAVPLQEQVSSSTQESIAPQKVQPMAAKRDVSRHVMKVADLSIVQPPQDDFFEVLISEIESPSSLYVQLAKVEVERSLQQLGAQLMSACAQAPAVDVKDLTDGDVVAARFSGDQRWYRAVICAISAAQIDVRFVDYGNKDVVDAKSICHLHSQFLDLPCQAFHCGLAKVSGAEADGTWSPKAKQVLQSLVSKPLCAQVVGMKDKQHLIELIDTSSSEDVNLAEQLIQAGLAVQPGRDKLTVEDIKFVEPPSGEEFFEGMLSEVKSPASLFVQIATQEVVTSLSTLLQQLNTHCRKETSRLNVRQLVVGDVCAARYSADGNWYRAAVVGLTAGQATVRFLDFGNEEIVAGDGLCHLDSSFLSLPCQAMHCALSGIQSAQKDGSWPDGAQQSIQKHTGVRLCIRCCQKVNSIFYVDMFNTSSSEDVDLAKELVAARFAMEASASRSTMTTGPIVPSARIPSENEFRAVVVDVQSAGDMHIQVVEPETIRELTDMITDMARVFNSVSPNVDYRPDKGEMCCARFSSDQTWYRAVVDNFTVDRSHYQVTFIDFGNPDVVPLEDIHPLPAEFCKLPRLAVPCVLAGVKPRPGVRVWCEESTKFIQDHAPMSRSFLARVMGRSDSMLAVDLVDMSSGKEVHLCNQLIDAGLALHEDTLL